MSKRIAIALVAAFALLMSLDPGIASANPAKGILQSKPPNPGESGTIIVTEGETVRPPPTDDPDAPAVITINPGDAVSFTEPTKATEGDLVEFTITFEGDGSLVAEGITVVASGTLITGAHDGNVTVGAGEGVVISGASVGGNVKVDGGVLVITGGSVIEGNLKADDDAFILIDDGSRVVGHIDVQMGFLSVRSTDVFEDGILAEGYCVKCKAKKEMQGRSASEVVMKNQAKALKKTCGTCGTKVFRILGKA